MSEYEDGPRPLPFPLRNSAAYPERTTEDDPADCGVAFVWPEDPDERTIVPFLLSQREWTVLGSSIDVGSDIAYGADAIRVMWLWMRNMRCAVAICSAIIDCVSNDDDVKNAIINMLKSSEDFNNYISSEVRRLTQGQVSGKIVGGNCDNSVVAGRALQLVDRLDQNNIDFLEIVEVGTNDEEKIAALLEAIPIADELPIGDLIEFLQDILEDFAENYAAASTVERRDEAANAIYCIMKDSDDCSLSYLQLFAYFQQKAGSGLTISSVIQQIVDFVVDGDFNTDDLIFNAMMALQIAVINAGQQFAGMNLPAIGGLMRDAIPSTIWEDWGDCPEFWSKTIDFKAESGAAWGVTGDLPEDPAYSSSWIPGSGRIGTQAGALDRNFAFWQLPAEAHITYFRFEWEPQIEGLANSFYGFNEVLGNSALIGETLFREGSADLDSDSFVFGLERAGGDVSFAAYLTKVTLSGTGPSPFA